MEAVGPGVRLLAIEDTRHLRSGTIYTCREVFSWDQMQELAQAAGMHGGAMCGRHGPECQVGGVRIVEVQCSQELHPDSPFCLGSFRPLGGSLPAELTECLRSLRSRPRVEAWADA